MEKISRRVFLRRSSVSAAAVGSLAAFPGLTGLRSRLRPPEVHSSGVAEAHGSAGDDTIVVHIPDPRTGRLHLMFGTREVVRHDPALVERLVQSAN